MNRPPSERKSFMKNLVLILGLVIGTSAFAEGSKWTCGPLRLNGTASKSARSYSIQRTNGTTYLIRSNLHEPLRTIPMRRVRSAGEMSVYTADGVDATF